MDFDSFWEVYPRRIGKKKAEKAWEKNIQKKIATPEEMVIAAQNYARARMGQDSLYTMYPSTFLGPLEWWREFAKGIPSGYNAAEEQKIQKISKYEGFYL